MYALKKTQLCYCLCIHHVYFVSEMKTKQNVPNEITLKYVSHNDKNLVSNVNLIIKHIIALHFEIFIVKLLLLTLYKSSLVFILENISTTATASSIFFNLINAVSFFFYFYN